MTEFRSKGKGKDRRVYPVNKVNKKPFGVPSDSNHTVELINVILEVSFKHVRVDICPSLGIAP